jgi:hypothetical protein
VAGPPQPEAVMARGHARQRRRRAYGMAVHHLPGKASLSMVIDPSGIPSGVGLQLAFSKLDGSASGIFSILSRIALVRVSQQCTAAPAARPPAARPPANRRSKRRPT